MTRAGNGRDDASGQRQDRLDGYFTIIVWREHAEHVADSLPRGDRVVVTGRVVTRSYDKDGDTRYITEIVALEVCPSLRWTTATIAKADRPRSIPDAADDDVPF